MAQESGSKDVEMAVEGEEKEGAKEGGEEVDKQQVQKDKDLLTFEGEHSVAALYVASSWVCFRRGY